MVWCYVAPTLYSWLYGEFSALLVEEDPSGDPPCIISGITALKMFTSITGKVHWQYWYVIHGLNWKIFVWNMVFTKDSNITWFIRKRANTFVVIVNKFNVITLLEI